MLMVDIFNRIQRVALILMIFFCPFGMRGQSYQTNFEPSPFEKSPAPFVFTGIAGVSTSSGGLDIQLGLGSGIGNSAIRFVPSLRGGVTGTIWASKTPLNFLAMGAEADSQVSIAPGLFTLNLKTAGSGAVYYPLSYFSTPSGDSASVNTSSPMGIGVAPSSVINGTIPSLLNQFGYAGYSLVNDPNDTTLPMWKMASDDSLVLGIQNQNSDPCISVRSPSSHIYKLLPPRILVVKNYIIYEYSYLDTYVFVSEREGPDRIDRAKYRLTKMYNRFNDWISFLYPNDSGYIATFYSNGTKTGGTIQLSATSVQGNYKLSYTGESSNCSFIIRMTVEDNPFNGIQNYTIGGKYEYLSKVKLFEIKDEFSQESVIINYVESPEFRYRDVPKTVEVIGSIVYSNGRTVTYSWTPIQYLPALGEGRERWTGYTWQSTSLPKWTMAVSSVDDADTDCSPKVHRITSYERTVPLPILATPSTFSDTTFKTVVVYPTGYVESINFVQPISGSNGGPLCSLENQFQTLAFLKHQVREIRKFSSTARLARDMPDSISFSDRFDIRRIRNPLSDMNLSSTIYPTRNVTFDPYAGLISVIESRNWSQSQRGWEKTLSQVCGGQAPALEYLSCAITGSEPSYSGLKFDRSISKTLDSNVEKWIWSQVVSESELGKFPITRVFDSTTGAVTSVSYNDAAPIEPTETEPKIILSYEYDSGVAQPKSITLSSVPALSGSGSTGAFYEYDQVGLLNNIQLRKTVGGGKWPWSEARTLDSFGRVLDMTDPNSFKRIFDWDDSGRIRSVSLPGDEHGSSYTYDPNQRKVLIESGVQKREVCFNGFGEPVLERRWNGNLWSHRITSYDQGGRKTFESVWASGPGDETLWGSSSVQTSYIGSSIAYDGGQSRVIQLKDANGKIVRTSYNDSEMTKTEIDAYQTTSAVSTVFHYDALGRLIKIVDCLGNPVEYQYDLAGHLTRVNQTDNATAASQIRLRTYNRLGWLTSSSEPETGLNEYSEWTVTGNAQKINFNGKILKKTYDSLGRVLQYASSDGTILGTNTYDESGCGFSNGKITHDATGSIARAFSYGGRAGRLSLLETTVPGAPLFSQTFHYNTYGLRDNSTVKAAGELSRTIDLDYFDELSLEKGLKYNSNPVTSSTYGPVDWNLANMNYANNIASSTYQYDNDQLRTKNYTHTVTGSSGNSISKQWVFDYDPLGWIHSTGEDTYGYDGLSRLTSASIYRPDRGTTLSQGFQYDGFGNLISATAGQDAALVRQTFSFSRTDSRISLHNQLPASIAGASYDAQGNLTQIYATPGNPNDARSMAYDCFGRMTELTNSTDGTTEYYQYNGDGLRTTIDTYQGGNLIKRKINIYNDRRQLVSIYTLD